MADKIPRLTLSDVEPYEPPTMPGPPTMTEPPKEPEVVEYDMKSFLEKVPPGKEVVVPDFVGNGSDIQTVHNPRLDLYCSNERCRGMRFFEAIHNHFTQGKAQINSHISYQCNNCGASVKVYSIRATSTPAFRKWKVIKYGEIPSFGPPTPSKVTNLIKGERNLLMLGRRCENQGMGIGAFVYYRRVIESQKNRILDKMISVIEKVSPGNEVIDELKAAKEEVQFTKAVESIKKGLPDSLLINNHNPLTLLHRALSAGLHEHDDAKCLELANDVRVVLFEFAERLGQALKENADLNRAITRLTNKKE